MTSSFAMPPPSPSIRLTRTGSSSQLQPPADQHTQHPRRTGLSAPKASTSWSTQLAGQPHQPPHNKSGVGITNAVHGAFEELFVKAKGNLQALHAEDWGLVDTLRERAVFVDWWAWRQMKSLDYKTGIQKYTAGMWQRQLASYTGAQLVPVGHVPPALPVASSPSAASSSSQPIPDHRAPRLASKSSKKEAGALSVNDGNQPGVSSIGKVAPAPQQQPIEPLKAKSPLTSDFLVAPSSRHPASPLLDQVVAKAERALPRTPAGGHHHLRGANTQAQRAFASSNDSFIFPHTVELASLHWSNTSEEIQFEYSNGVLRASFLHHNDLFKIDLTARDIRSLHLFSSDGNDSSLTLVFITSSRCLLQLWDDGSSSWLTMDSPSHRPYPFLGVKLLYSPDTLNVLRALSTSPLLADKMYHGQWSEEWELTRVGLALAVGVDRLHDGTGSTRFNGSMECLMGYSSVVTTKYAAAPLQRPPPLPPTSPFTKGQLRGRTVFDPRTTPSTPPRSSVIGPSDPRKRAREDDSVQRSSSRRAASPTPSLTYSAGSGATTEADLDDSFEPSILFSSDEAYKYLPGSSKPLPETPRKRHRANTFGFFGASSYPMSSVAGLFYTPQQAKQQYDHLVVLSGDPSKSSPPAYLSAGEFIEAGL